jgi:chromosome segregation ATPase
MVANNSSPEKIQFEFFYEGLKEVQKELKAVGHKVGEVLTDIALIKEKTSQIASNIEQLNDDHKLHKKEVNERIERCEERIGSLEDRHSSWKNKIAGALALVMALGFAANFYKDVQDLKKENEKLINDEVHLRNKK